MPPLATQPSHALRTEEFIRVLVRRGEIDESEHLLAAAVYDIRQGLLVSLGDPARCLSLRSAAKPLQFAPLLQLSPQTWLAMDDEEIAICCASHGGTARQVQLVERVLARAGASHTALVCPPAGEPPSPLHHGCSGNHAGLLLQARLMGAPVEGYHLLDHPVQQSVVAVAKELTGERHLVFGTDGCGIPALGVSLAGAARAYACLANPSGQWIRISKAMARHPELLGAETWPDVRLIRATSGRLFAKTGAEGLLCVGHLKRAAGLVIKALDGSTRPLWAAATALLEHLGWITEEVACPGDASHSDGNVRHVVNLPDGVPAAT